MLVNWVEGRDIHMCFHKYMPDSILRVHGWFAGRNASRDPGLQAQLLKRVATWMAGSIMSLLQPSAGYEDMLDGPQTALKSLQPHSLGDARVAAKVCTILLTASGHDSFVALSAASVDIAADLLTKWILS